MRFIPCPGPARGLVVSRNAVYVVWSTLTIYCRLVVACMLELGGETLNTRPPNSFLTRVSCKKSKQKVNKEKNSLLKSYKNYTQNFRKTFIKIKRPHQCHINTNFRQNSFTIENSKILIKN